MFFPLLIQHALFTKEINKIIPENQILKQIKREKMLCRNVTLLVNLSIIMNIYQVI